MASTSERDRKRPKVVSGEATPRIVDDAFFVSQHQNDQHREILSQLYPENVGLLVATEMTNLPPEVTRSLPFGVEGSKSKYHLSDVSARRVVIGEEMMQSFAPVRPLTRLASDGVAMMGGGTEVEHTQRAQQIPIVSRRQGRYERCYISAKAQ